MSFDQVVFTVAGLLLLAVFIPVIVQEWCSMFDRLRERRDRRRN